MTDTDAISVKIITDLSICRVIKGGACGENSQIMTEVPEVEIYVRDLCAAVVGRRLLGVEVQQPAAVRFPEAPEFSTQLAGREVLDANRRAKFILITLSGDLVLAVHLMLWGALLLTSTSQKRLPETMIVFHLDRDEDLRLLDKLGYARAAVGPPEILAERLDLEGLGPEALDPAFDVDTLARQLNRRGGSLKAVLLNQRVLAGLGNRDADESLWLARLDPTRPAASLSADELARLQAAIVQVLVEGISLRGTMPDLFGQRGRAKHRRHVFERTGLPCPRCGGTIARIRIGGRNTHYCPHCQKGDNNV
jgi:formamidopyrimidine-DNA glycosylase